jgi:hypothetical protein
MTVKLAAMIFLAALIAYGIVEVGWGGGDPNDPHHNRPPWPLW